MILAALAVLSAGVFAGAALYVSAVEHPARVSCGSALAFESSSPVIDTADGRALRYLDWAWDPDPTDEAYLVDYASLLRAAGGSVSVVPDRHVEGLFSRASGWIGLPRPVFAFTAKSDRFGRVIFVGTPGGYGRVTYDAALTSLVEKLPGLVPNVVRTAFSKVG